MSNVYIYSPDSTDYSTFGLIGAIPASEVIFEEATNSYSEVSITIPIDPEGRHMLIREGCVISADVPVPYTPVLDGSSVVTVVETYTVSLYATSNERRLYKTRTGNKKLKVVPVGTKVVVVESSTDWSRWKVKTPKHGTHWIDVKALTSHETVNVTPDVGSLDEILGSDNIKTQYFRVYAVKRDMSKVSVKTEHISYDLNKDITHYSSNTPVDTPTALHGILEQCSDEAAELYTIHTNIGTVLTQASYKLRNPINAMIDPEEGIAARVNGSFVRDNYDLYLLGGLERYKGFRIQYGMNLTGFAYEEDWSDVRTRVICTAKNSSDNQILMDAKTYASSYTPERIGDSMVLGQDKNGAYYFESARANLAQTNPELYPGYAADYPVPKYEVIDTGLKQSTSMSLTSIQRKMIEAARAFFENGGDIPRVSLKVDFYRLSSDSRYKYLEVLEKVRLWDIVRIIYPAHGVDVFARCTRIKWDVLRGKIIECEFESIESSQYFRLASTSDDQAYDNFITRDGDSIVTTTYTVR